MAKRSRESGEAASNAGKSKPGRPGGKGAPPRLLAGGNPQIAKGDGDESVQRYIAAMPGWKRDVGRRIDAAVERALSVRQGLRKAVKWNSPFYGVEDSDGTPAWFLSFHCFARYVKVGFFQGAQLRPLPPGESKQKDVRYLDIHQGDHTDRRGRFDESQFVDWVKQASRLSGVRM